MEGNQKYSCNNPIPLVPLDERTFREKTVYFLQRYAPAARLAATALFGLECGMGLNFLVEWFYGK